MDSCSSSPSHSFKDRPRSHHGELSRQTSFPPALDGAKSPVGKAVSESRDASAWARDPTRRSCGDCSVEKNAADGIQERSRNSLKKTSWFGRPVDTKFEMHRSARSGCVSRNCDRESGECGGRSDHKRSSYGELAHRQENFEGMSSSPPQIEKESSGSKAASKKCYAKDGGDGKWSASASPEDDREHNKSPVSSKGTTKNDGKEAFKGSPKRHGSQQSSRKDMASDKDCTMTFSVRKEAAERGKLSPRKPSAREPHDDVDAASSKTRPAKFKDLDKLKEQEVSSGETEARACHKSLSSKPRDGALDVEEVHEAKSLHADACRERSPVSFLHVSKRARSERDRGRRDEHTGKSTGRYSQWNEVVKGDSHKATPLNVVDHDSLGKKSVVDDKESNIIPEVKENEESSARSVNTGAMHECHSPLNRCNSDMEEGEVEPESSPTTPSFAGAGHANDMQWDEMKRETCTVSLTDTKSKELCESQFKVGSGEEDKLGVNLDEIGRIGEDETKSGNGPERSLPLADKEESRSEHIETQSMNIHFEAKNLQISTSNALELGESSRAGKLFDLLGAKGEMNNCKLPLSADTDIEASNELTLSLFTNPNQMDGCTQSKGDQHVLGSNGKKEGKAKSSEIGGGEESSQLSGHKQKKLKLESLQLSLALPGSSYNAADPDALPHIGPAEPSRSFQSLNQTQTYTQTQPHNFLQSQTYTNSDGFTSSFSFSQSESFIHNPSCSLNCTSFENQELSCGGTRQLSQGTEHMSNRSWPGLSGNEHGMHTVTSVSHDKSKHRRGIPLYQRVLQNGSMHQGFPSVTGSNRSSGSNHFSQKSYHHGQRLQEAPKILDSSSHDLDVSGRPVTTHKDIIERVRQQKAWFASKQQAMSAEPQQIPTAGQDRDKREDPPLANGKGITITEKDIMLGERALLSEKIGLHEITIDPVAIMAQKLQELPDSFLDGLKGVARGVLCSFEKREEFLSLQENIRRRKDLTEDSLLQAHHAQLEILVALKTGCQTFVQEGSKRQTYKVLIEIFLESRCRNIGCSQPLLVHECECRVCSKKSGFCRECMCVVCFKFDSDNSTCRWLGCDLCLHWCHTDCALRMSYIAPTLTDKIANGTTEMQYHCVACDHKSELYGFVKDVFQNCAENWGVETLTKELDCVRKIFHGSDDMRGKQLCWKAEQMLQKLENKVNATEVCRSMLRYLNEGNAELDGGCGPIKRSSSMKAAADILGRLSEPSRESNPKASASGVMRLVDTDNARVVLQKLERNAEEKSTEAAELQYERARKRVEIEQMESEIRVKQAEAKMFQIRADETRQEAAGLECIISRKKEKIDEDYACKYSKLKLNETDERHQKRHEELKALENAQQDFQNLRVKMEAYSKELMLKMEIAAKRQCT